MSKFTAAPKHGDLLTSGDLIKFPICIVLAILERPHQDGHFEGSFAVLSKKLTKAHPYFLPYPISFSTKSAHYHHI